MSGAKPTDVFCPECAALVGWQCVDKDGQPTSYHSVRIELAKKGA